MLKTFLNAFRVPDIRKKLVFTAAMLALYRIGAYIPAPGINVDAVKDISDNFTGSNVLGFLNLFSGGRLQRFAIFALGIMPYITASIILQLMTVVVPRSRSSARRARSGSRRSRSTRATSPSAWPSPSRSATSSSSGRSLERLDVVDGFTFGRVFVIVHRRSPPARVLLMWLGELITQRGIGNGISLMIFASIVAGIPNGIERLVDEPGPGLQGDDAVRRARGDRGRRVHPGGPAPDPGPVRQARRRPAHVRRRLDLPAAAREHGGRDPGDLRRLADGVPADGRRAQPGRLGARHLNFFAPTAAPYIVGESVLIILFTYFYTAVTFNPVEQADNLKKYGGFIPGVRPGRPTAEFLDRILARLTFPGALYLAAVAALPTILINQTGANFFFGGTSILIVVGVALDTMKQLEAQLMMRNYEGFLK